MPYEATGIHRDVRSRRLATSYVHVTSSYAHVTSSFHIHRDVDFATLSEEEQKARYMQAGVLKVCLNPKP